MILEQIYFPSPHTWVPSTVQTNGICSGRNLEAYFPDRFSRHSLIKLNLMFKNYTFVFIKLESWKFIKEFTQQPWISGYSELSTALGIRYMRQIRSHSQESPGAVASNWLLQSLFLCSNSEIFHEPISLFSHPNALVRCT